MEDYVVDLEKEITHIARSIPQSASLISQNEGIISHNASLKPQFARIIPHNANDPNVLSETNKNNPKKKRAMENVVEPRSHF